MSGTQHVWSSSEFDAVSVSLPGGDVEISAADDERVTLSGVQDTRLPHLDRLEVVDRWLLIHLWTGQGDGTPLSLNLPHGKPWLVDIQMAHGDVAIADVLGRLQVVTGQGDIAVSDCRGRFSLTTGSGDVSVEQCSQAQVPEALAQPGEGGASAAAGRLASAMTALERGLERLPGADDAGTMAAGLSISVGSGDVEIEDVDFETCRVRIGQGDATLSGGRLGALRLHIGRGDIECDAVAPLSEWRLETAVGDIKLGLPGNVAARLDLATRHGSLRSDVPMVRVARPGPEAHHGGRLVGSVGGSDQQPAQISLTTSKGDIAVELAEDSPLAAGLAVATTDNGAPSGAIAADSTVEAIATGPDSSRPAGTTPAAHPAYESQMAVLQALSDGVINAQEAEQLLSSM